MIIELNKQKEKSEERLWQLSEQSYLHGSSWSLDQFKQDVAQENSRYLIFTEENNWLGFISYYQVLDELDISHVVIGREYQRQGYGRLMLKEAISHWREQGFVRVLLEVRESNHGAQALYKEFGFQCIHTRKNYYHHPKEDGLIFELTL
ncbi:ribosomal protein S18-alanine N-acetyltransferase [Enterococcus sp. BWR-S5]|uniref:ribosomal protein S18-alanine N-acetyltransferase n=1 Tax=Enterococcus sp. BWR-S5 TaxID=2787714 RepID=UPI0019230DD5|nr:ribosomal protein S18-alanine N-acetyltransferase [Enterococcus sp. BWR-S5]MBL1226263.1 ribosomal protein S18-alanine N-acetyltransferase [Enterococcus sp. BWR-S5]